MCDLPLRVWWVTGRGFVSLMIPLGRGFSSEETEGLVCTPTTLKGITPEIFGVYMIIVNGKITYRLNTVQEINESLEVLTWYSGRVPLSLRHSESLLLTEWVPLCRS